MPKTSFQNLKTQIDSRPNLHPHSSLRGAFRGKSSINADSITFEGNGQRSNLTSPINQREFFNDCESTLLQNQSKEIAKSFVGCIHAPQVEFRVDDVCHNIRIRCINAPYIRFFFRSSLRGASWKKLHINTVGILFEGNERRSNLLSLINWPGLFDSCKITPLQNKSREIAKSLQQQVLTGHQCDYDNGMLPPVEDSFSWVEQQLTKLMSNKMRTGTRNDEEKCNWRISQQLQKGNLCEY